MERGGKNRTFFCYSGESETDTPLWWFLALLLAQGGLLGLQPGSSKSDQNAPKWVTDDAWEQPGRIVWGFQITASTCAL